MAIFVIADLHLSIGTGAEKSMEVFGPRWADYTEKLRKNWSCLVGENDTVIIPGDISWAISLEEARPDFDFLHTLPGKKILMKGNHDFWWTSMKKMESFCREGGYDDISFLYHDAVRVENFILTGTRGWFLDDGEKKPSGEEIARLTAREAIRFDIALQNADLLKQEAPEAEIIAFFHFPPVWGEQICTPLTSMIEEAGIKRVFYGHIHGAYGLPQTAVHHDVVYKLIAADYISFVPQHIPEM